MKKSIIYRILLGVMALKIIGLFILFQLEKPVSSVSVVEAKQAIAQEALPTTSKPTDSKPTDSKPTDSKATDSKPADTQLKLDPSLDTNPQTQIFSDPDNAHLENEVFEREREELKREKQIMELEKEQLQTLKNEINDKIESLTKIQGVVEQKIEEQKTLIRQYQDMQESDQDKQFKHLLKIYSSMPAKKSAALIDKLDLNVVVKLLSKMKGENVGQILSFVSPEKAARISEVLAKQD